MDYFQKTTFTSLSTICLASPFRAVQSLNLVQGQETFLEMAFSLLKYSTELRKLNFELVLSFHA